MTEAEIQDCVDAGRFTLAMAERWREMSTNLHGDRLSPSVAEIQAEERAAQIDAWHTQRMGALWAGLDMDALRDRMHIADDEDFILDVISMMFTQEPDRQKLKMHEIKKRLVDQALRQEQEDGAWK